MRGLQLGLLICSWSLMAATAAQLRTSDAAQPAVNSALLPLCRTQGQSCTGQEVSFVRHALLLCHAPRANAPQPSAETDEQCMARIKRPKPCRCALVDVPAPDEESGARSDGLIARPAGTGAWHP